MALALTLYGILFAIAVFAPLRWSIAAYALLSVIDFSGTRADVGLLNSAKAIVLPLYLLWRLREYSGHTSIALAPIAWLLLIVYAGVSAFWSFYPVEALKLLGHMAGLLVICFVFVRAAKGGYLTPGSAIPITIGCLGLAVLRTVVEPGWADERSRFTAFTTAQGFAALLAALYCVFLCSKNLRMSIRVPLSVALVVALVFDGSRIWCAGIAIASLVALLISQVRPWIKISIAGALIILIASIIGASGTVIEYLDRAPANRIAAAITSFYEGDLTSYGLGTFRFRRELTARVVDNLEASSLGELVLGHGTSNGAAISGSKRSYVDPNRFFHNEWLRVAYEWGLVGLILWLLFLGSVAVFAYESACGDSHAGGKPLLAYFPAFLLALAGENFIAGAGNAVSTGLLMLIGLAGTARRAPAAPEAPTRELEFAGGFAN